LVLQKRGALDVFARNTIDLECIPFVEFDCLPTGHNAPSPILARFATSAASAFNIIRPEAMEFRAGRAALVAGPHSGHLHTIV
jgi:hypothetical protein